MRFPPGINYIVSKEEAAEKIRAEMNTETCKHKWVVLRECPMCVIAERDSLRAEAERLNIEVIQRNQVIKRAETEVERLRGALREVLDAPSNDAIARDAEALLAQKEAGHD